MGARLEAGLRHEITMATTMPPFTPVDSNDQRLISNVHPSGWRNPQPADRYNLLFRCVSQAGWDDSTSTLLLPWRFRSARPLPQEKRGRGPSPFSPLLNGPRASAIAPVGYGVHTPTPMGLRHSGPRCVEALGTVIIALGPAFCDPLNGVVPLKPQVAASDGLSNQMPA